MLKRFFLNILLLFSAALSGDEQTQIETVPAETSVQSSLIVQSEPAVPTPQSHSPGAQSEPRIAKPAESAQIDTANKTNNIPTAQRRLYIRVLLDEISQASLCEWDISSQDKLIIRFENPDATVASKSPNAQMKIADGMVYLNGAKVESERISFRSSDNIITYNGMSYFGSLSIVKQGESFYLINKVELEDYICSVLATESWPGWPLEINKVFAVTCRTYAISVALRSKKQKSLYHVRNTNHHQTYKGMTKKDILRRAVEDTKGMFIMYDNKPILAMFDSCCGGVVPAHIDDFNFEKAPYLARTYACTHCKESKLYRWTHEFDVHTFHDLLSESFSHVIPLREIKVTKKDKAGLAKEVWIRHKGGIESITGKSLYGLSPKIKSYCFDVKKRGSKVIFQGRGFGHHLGLCQWGARAMVDKGWDFMGIISYYYPGTSLARLS